MQGFRSKSKHTQLVPARPNKRQSRLRVWWRRVTHLLKRVGTVALAQV